ncbi:heme exporter protein CcmB [Citromicrobium bathyomarinum]|uniref:heme exporter protein CcmB n=1 Tax=Citromicrobium bathyomarinum TaxID=72174 RepID=UPI00315A95CB
MRTFAILLRRDLAILLPGGARGSAFLPLIFFLLVAVLFPFAVGPEPTLLARTGGGVLWIATLLASILPLDRLVAADREAGVFDQLRLRGISEEVAMTARLLAHWLCFAPLMILATLPAAALLSLSGETLARLVVSLIAGTPGLAAIGLITAALLASLRAGTALAGLLLAPIAVPLVIFGAGHLARDDLSGALFAGAFSLVLCAIAPFAAAAAIRAARD